MHPSRRSPHTPPRRQRVRKMAFALARRSREHGQRVFKSGFFCAAFLSVALTASPNHTSPPARGFPLKTTPTGEGWRLRFFVTGDRPNTHSRAEKKRL